MSGLIAGHYFDKWRPTILEAQKGLPNNHEALLRFRTDKAAKVTGVPFKKVMVRKAIMTNGDLVDRCTPYLANLYSRKVTDEVSDRSIWDMSPGERYVAPGDFISAAARGLRISYDSAVRDFEWLRTRSEPIISTIPMPVLMALADWKDRPDFRWRPIWSIQCEIIDPSVDVYQTIHYPEYDKPYYRASITGRKLIIECNNEPENVSDILIRVASDFGLWPCAFDHDVTPKYQEYGKIIASDRQKCQDFMYAMTREHGIYSLGRFATWRQLLLDDVVDDCAVIERLINAEARHFGYQQQLRQVKAVISH